MPIAMDFGTCNTVLARWNRASERCDLINLGALTRNFSCRVPGSSEKRRVEVAPTLIHYGAGRRRLLGEQVNSEGLIDHPGTFRWIKLDILRGNTRTRRINDRRISPGESGADFIRDILTFALAGQADFINEDFVVTVPVESYDHYVNWLRGTVEGVIQSQVHIIDEATACILGYQQVIRDGEIYLLFDFGGGTLDISLVKVNLEAEGISKCTILGRAGEELGGILVDKWMLAEMKNAGALSDDDIHSVGVPILQEIEKAKIDLSGGDEKADVTQLNYMTNRVINYTFTREKLTQILAGNKVQYIISRTLNSCLDQANDKYGTRKRDIKSVFMVGGSSLLLGIPDLVKTLVPDVPVQCHDPFTSIASGACRYIGEDFNPTLVHDYCLRCWDPDAKEFILVPVIPRGTNYPTERPMAARYIDAACDGASELGMVICERSDMLMPGTIWVVGEDGRMREERKGEKLVEKIRELNPWAKRFLRAVPPCKRKENRFIASFGVNPQKMLTISLEDTKQGNTSYIVTSEGEHIPLPIKNFPLVRL